ncbi:RluA family pseudouridine synthase [Microvirga sp. W0021]|uniref:Pseudouridine synthase n=1 Tax=Hohaiivirga grylli TaxID=3133970 RepID=A0ABV0BLI4_9HYPH
MSESEVREVQIAEDEAVERLDRALAKALPDMSRNRLQGLIKDGQVTIDGAVVADTKRKVGPGAVISLIIPPTVAAEPVSENIPLNVIYEDDELIVIDKQAGLVVHPAAGHETGTLVNALINHCGESLSGIGGVKRPGIVHRLDKDTTGLMVVAKTDRAHQGLAAQFADHGRTGPLERSYLALVWGAPDRKKGTIDAPLARSPHNREKIAVVRQWHQSQNDGEEEERSRGRFAITHYSVEQTFNDGQEQPFVALVRCTLETGRTHQIRVHMSHIGHPLLGDMTYGAGFLTKISKLRPETREALETLGRQALHAAVLGFEHPVTGEVMYFESAIPDDMQRVVKCLQK